MKNRYNILVTKDARQEEYENCIEHYQSRIMHITYKDRHINYKMVGISISLKLYKNEKQV
jgi:hypothetical protein